MFEQLKYNKTPIGYSENEKKCAYDVVKYIRAFYNKDHDANPEKKRATYNNFAFELFFLGYLWLGQDFTSWDPERLEARINELLKSSEYAKQLKEVYGKKIKPESAETTEFFRQYLADLKEIYTNKKQIRWYHAKPKKEIFYYNALEAMRILFRQSENDPDVADYDVFNDPYWPPEENKEEDNKGDK